MNQPPPPPPPHGTQSQQKNGLPDGNYDIFIIPPHSSGGGFLYLPSLRTHRNSFLAGVICTLFAVLVWTIVIPAVKEWTATIVTNGGSQIFWLMLAVGVLGWLWGKAQIEGVWPEEGPGRRGPQPQPAEGATPKPQEQYQAPPQSHPNQPPPNPPKPSWQRSTGAGAGTGATGAGQKGGWEKAREETRKREEERKRDEELRKRTEELRKKREEDEKDRQKQREKDARERELRETREKRDKERQERERARTASPTKGHRQPTAKTASDDDAFSYRPYDKPKAGTYKTAASSIYSESSYAPSQSTARTTPPPSQRGPYRNKDPDKISVKAVYAFTNAFTKTPIAKLVSGMGAVTDGLILRMSTEGLFIDDDVRGVPQREWDVKAWTLKLVEVCTDGIVCMLSCSIKAYADLPSDGRIQRHTYPSGYNPRS